MDFSRNTDVFCITDVGSTTTKAILFKKEERWGYVRKEAPTTVEKPHEDVTIGVVNALRELEKATGERLLDRGAPCVPYLSTSSAGGGLAMVVTGLVHRITAKSAQRVALGAGAIVLDVIALDDGRTPYKKMERLKELRPDMLLMAGGFDGDALSGPVFLAEVINQAELHPKGSKDASLPIIYAGNTHARDYVRENLEQRFHFHAVANLRPASTRENLEPARDAIHALFMEHVMSHAPGYDRLKGWVAAPILPTPSAFGSILSIASARLDRKILAVDIGGATTDVFTLDKGGLFRTVSANLGMSYSILNVVEKAGIDTVRSFLDLQMTDEEMLDIVGNKHLRPTRLAGSREELKVECAAATAAIREAVKDHLQVLEGVALSHGEEELSLRKTGRKRKPDRAHETLSLQGYDMVLGSGGVLSHLPRESSLWMLVNALMPEGRVRLAVDSAFMFPHLGMLSKVAPDLAFELLQDFGLVNLGTLITPGGAAHKGARRVVVERRIGEGRTERETVEPGRIRLFSERGEAGESISIKSGAGDGFSFEPDAERSLFGLIVDTRPRPAAGNLRFPELAGYNAPPTLLADTAAATVQKGSIVLPRELAIAGEVFVSPGQQVEGDTVIAKATRTFQRLFFLPVAANLKVPPEELAGLLVKQVGDEVAFDEVLAEKRRPFRRQFRSTVEGRIEKVLTDGTVVVRERIEFMKEMTTVNAAKDLAVRPHKLKPYMRVSEGQEVEKDQVIAGFLSARGRVSRSPVRGRVKEINLAYGIVIIEPLLEELQLRAWLPGRVDTVTDRGCVITSEGILIPGIWGKGAQASGCVSFSDPARDAIMVAQRADRDLLTRLMACRARGLVTGSVHLKDVMDLNPQLTIVVLEGFGDRPMQAEARDLLKAHEGRLALLDGTTQMRAGVRRPKIILVGQPPAPSRT